MNRPNMFVKELKMYIDYLKNEIKGVSDEMTSAQIKKWQLFKNNLAEGIEYYQSLFSSMPLIENTKGQIQSQLLYHRIELSEIEIPELS